ncbi:lysophospholipase L1-like esterase [Arthrobacter sp. B3I9]|uniref:SGNH/GDSL hydrolase family protein n=1 Tax=Arthrobacter sp. B3I9 TaxID=3042270 RepID=UPI0027912E09|nr:SGNH/GDSL hydrolase family protein [Arthrobacter sp. B3I9]MDQ0848574.1 lysophospholipase L1-like esterase [Arthrobacter sp. B3I9]
MDFSKPRNRNKTSFPFGYAKELGFGLLAVVAIVVVLLALTMRDNDVNAAPAPSSAALPTSHPAVPNVDIIGDSYVGGSDEGGYGAANWTKIVGSRFYAESRPVDMNVMAVPGGGYITRGPDKLTFAEAAVAQLRSSADLVLVFGSRNDGKQDAATMTAAATDLFAKIHERAPKAKLVVVGPAWVNENVPAFISANTQVISAAASTAGATFVSPLSEGWFFGANAKLIGGDGVHPTDAGHQYMAEKMYVEISKNLATTTTP